MEQTALTVAVKSGWKECVSLLAEAVMKSKENNESEDETQENGNERNQAETNGKDELPGPLSPKKHMSEALMLAVDLNAVELAGTLIDKGIHTHTHAKEPTETKWQGRQ